MHTLTRSSDKTGALHAIVSAWLLCGVMDITAAFVTANVTRGMKPMRLLQGIASGCSARSPSMAAGHAALGLACHFFIAFSAASVFYVASRRLALLTKQPTFSGVVYGVVVYTVMYWIVLPSVFGPRPFNWSVTLIALLTHIVCVGTPISLMVHSYSS